MSDKKLGRYLFIGLGGSGGKTLQYLYNNLEIKLSSVNKSMPEGWQFLWIDVPQDQDALDTGTGIKPLSDRFYQPLTQPGATFDSFDYSLRRKHPAIQNHLAEWSPEAQKIKTEIIDGAGQFRAIGRIVTMKSYPIIHNKISEILSNMKNAKVLAELEDINESINPNPDDDSGSSDNKPPMIIFISSLAGGSGAGSTIDVADIVRSVVDNSGIYPDQSVGILYTPDIFLGEPDLRENSTIFANSLFTICEIISGWHDSERGQPDSDIWKAFDMLPPASKRRGPRYNFLIGRGNQKITFQEPIDIFRNTGKLIAEWCLNPKIDADIRSFLLTNWENDSANQPTYTGLSNNISDGTKPYDSFNSLGYSSVSLGREYFRKYAEERVAKLAVTHLVRAHWDKDTGISKTKEKALSEATERILSNDILFKNSGLNTNIQKDNERGINDIEKSIQSKIASPQSGILKANYAEQIFNFATSDNEQRTYDGWTEKLKNSFDNNRETFFAEIEAEHIKNARSWVRNFNIEFVNFIADTVSEFGAPVTLEFVSSLNQRLIDALQQENGLHASQKNNQAWANNISEYINGILKVAGDDSFGKENDLMSQVKVQINKNLQYIIDENIAKIVSDLVDGVVKEVLPEIRNLLNEIISKGEINLDESIENGYGKILATWPDVNPTDAVITSENEVLVEDTSEYVEKFKELVNKTYREKGKREEDAINSLYKKVLRGSKYPENLSTIEDEQQIKKILSDCLVTIEKSWNPEKSYLNNGTAPEAPRYKVNIDIYSIKNRATKVLTEEGNPFGTYINESLNDYLDKERCSEVEHLERKTKFQNAFKSAISYSQPQIVVNSILHENIHEKKEEHKLKITPIDISNSSVKKVLTEELLPYFKNNEEEVKDLFTTKNLNSQSIKFYSYFGKPYDIAVVKSLWKPFIEKWKSAKSNQYANVLADFWVHRRSRPLLEFVPIHPENLASLIKGFFIARLMKIYKTNREEIDDKTPNLIAEIEIDNFGYVQFPSPLVEPYPDTQDELGSLILSMPIAIGLVSTETNKDALKPYERLIKLGSNKDGFSDIKGISKEFKKFLESKSDEEIDKILLQVNTFLGGYEEISLREIYSSNLNKYDRKPGLGWEIAPTIVTILDSLTKSIENFKQDKNSGDGNKLEKH